MSRLEGLEVQLRRDDRLSELSKVQLERGGDDVQVVGVRQLAYAVDAGVWVVTSSPSSSS